MELFIGEGVQTVALILEIRIQILLERGEKMKIQQHE